MKILAYYVRGLGSRVKWKVAKDLIIREDLSLVCLEETKMKELQNKVCGAVWGDQHVEWKHNPTLNHAREGYCVVGVKENL